MVSARDGAPRNPLGFMDGTGNPALGSAAFTSTVWCRGGSQPRWFVNGTFLCYRRIRINIEAWDALAAGAQNLVIGRDKSTGAPLSGGTVRTPLNFSRRTSSGALAIPADSHVRLAAPQFKRSFITHTATGVWAVPPAPSARGWLGQGLVGD